MRGLIRTRAEVEMTIPLQNPTDFVANVEEIAAQINRNDNPRPMSAREVSLLRLQRRRGESEETVPLPPSFSALLRVDRDFTFWDEPLFGPTLDRREDGVFRSVTMTEFLRGPMFEDFPEDEWLWNDAGQPALIPLYSPGDQGVYLYIGEADEHGEYPIARSSTEPSVWISESSLAVHAAADTSHDSDWNRVWSPRSDAELDLGEDLEGSLERAKERNASWVEQEWWAKNEAVEAYFARF
jgi:hypothetical protein